MAKCISCGTRVVPKKYYGRERHTHCVLRYDECSKMSGWLLEKQKTVKAKTDSLTMCQIFGPLLIA